IELADVEDRLPVPSAPDCDTPDKPDLHGVASVSSQIHLHAERRQCARSPHPADVTGRVVCSAARATWSPNRSTYPTCITDEPSQRRINRSAQPASGSRPAPCSALPVAWCPQSPGEVGERTLHRAEQVVHVCHDVC